MVRRKLQDCFRGTYEFQKSYCRPPLACLRHTPAGHQQAQWPQRRRSHQRPWAFHSRTRSGSFPRRSPGHRHGLFRHRQGLLRGRRLEVIDDQGWKRKAFRHDACSLLQSRLPRDCDVSIICRHVRHSRGLMRRQRYFGGACCFPISSAEFRDHAQAGEE